MAGDVEEKRARRDAEGQSYSTGEVYLALALSDDRFLPYWAGLLAKSPVFRGFHRRAKHASPLRFLCVLRTFASPRDRLGFIDGRGVPRPYGFSA